MNSDIDMERVATLWEKGPYPDSGTSVDLWPSKNEFEDLLSIELGWTETPLVRLTDVLAAIAAEREACATRWEAAHGCDKYGVAKWLRLTTKS